MSKLLKKTGVVLAAVMCACMVSSMMVNAQETSKTLEYKNFEDIRASIETEQGNLAVSEMSLKENKYFVTYEENDVKEATSNSPRIVVSYPKTLIVWYDEYNDMTELYYYEEFSSEYRTWCSGTLHLNHVDEYSGRYRVTYTGVLTGTI